MGLSFVDDLISCNQSYWRFSSRSCSSLLKTKMYRRSWHKSLAQTENDGIAYAWACACSKYFCVDFLWYPCGVRWKVDCLLVTCWWTGLWLLIIWNQDGQAWGFLYQVAGNLDTFEPWKQPCSLLVSYPKRKRKPCSIFSIFSNLEIDDMSDLVWGSILWISWWA